MLERDYPLFSNHYSFCFVFVFFCFVCLFLCRAAVRTWIRPIFLQRLYNAFLSYSLFPSEVLFEILYNICNVIIVDFDSLKYVCNSLMYRMTTKLTLQRRIDEIDPLSL